MGRASTQVAAGFSYQRRRGGSAAAAGSGRGEEEAVEEQRAGPRSWDGRVHPRCRADRAGLLDDLQPDLAGAGADEADRLRGSPREVDGAALV